MPKDFPEKYRKELSLCKKCGSCQAVCPVYEQSLDETLSPRGRLALASALLEGKLAPTENMLEKLSTCLSCMACSASCPNRVEVVSIFALTKNKLLGSGQVSTLLRRMIKISLVNRSVFRFLRFMAPYLARLYAVMPERGILSRITPFLEKGVKRVVPEFERADPSVDFAYLTPVQNPVARVILFTGCMTDLTNNDSTRAAVTLLRARRVEVCFPKGLYCCGAPAYFTGDQETARFLMKRNQEVFARFSAMDYILTTCGTCGTVLKDIYPELSGEPEARSLSNKVMDIQRFFREILPLSVPKPTSETSHKKRIKVTYHDPCHLRRGQGIFAEPRELLKCIPEIEYIEMKSPDLCCGGGGIFNIKYYGLSSSIASRKINNIQETGAEIVLTACPQCILQLRDMLHRAGLNIKVMHTMQLIESYLNPS